MYASGLKTSVVADALISINRIVANNDAKRAPGFEQFFCRKTIFGRTVYLTNLVLQGGGVLGPAHLGFVYGLEMAGIRFACVAGTSAGAIVALLMIAARGAGVQTPVAESILPHLSSMPASEFIDGPWRVRRLIKHALTTKQSNYFSLLPQSGAAMRRLLSHHGLNSGDRFLYWLDDLLARHFKLRTIRDLETVLQQTADNLSELLSTTVLHSDVLKINAVAMPLGMRFEFPEDRKILSRKYEMSSPAILARASMSIPFVFEPYKLELDSTEWRRRLHADFEGVWSSKALSPVQSQRHASFIDGGLISNFPLDSFVGQSDRLPTIGVALLSSDEVDLHPPTGSIRELLTFSAAMVNAARNCRDQEARRMARASSSKAKVALVDCRGHNWLDFFIEKQAMDELFGRGVSAAAQFLEKL